MKLFIRMWLIISTTFMILLGLIQMIGTASNKTLGYCSANTPLQARTNTLKTCQTNMFMYNYVILPSTKKKPVAFFYPIALHPGKGHECRLHLLEMSRRCQMAEPKAIKNKIMVSKCLKLMYSKHKDKSNGGNLIVKAQQVNGDGVFPSVVLQGTCYESLGEEKPR